MRVNGGGHAACAEQRTATPARGGSSIQDRAKSNRQRGAHSLMLGAWGCISIRCIPVRFEQLKRYEYLESLFALCDY